MIAFKERREVLLRAHMIDINAGDDDAPEVTLTEADRQERRVMNYAARIAAGLPLREGQRLGARIRRELADTDAEVIAKPVGCARRGRKPLSARTDRPFGERLNRDCRLIAARLAKRFRGGEVVVPAVVHQQFRGEPHLARMWSEHVRLLARRWRGRVAHSDRTNQGR